jgi:dipeptidyl aminopeptidase/acylaminoacyl peptidase
MRRSPSTVAACTLVCLLAAGAARGQGEGADPAVPTTPGPQDVPQAQPMDIGLAGDDRPDILRFLNTRSARQPSLAPDGSRVAFNTAITGEPQLWVVDGGGGWPRQLTFGRPTTFHRYSPAGDWIAYGSDRGGDEREGFYLVSPDGTRERELLAPSDAFRVFGAFSPDGSKIAYASTGRTENDFDIHLLDVASGEDRTAYHGQRGFFVASWRPDGGALLLSEIRGEDSNDIHFLDLASGEATPLFVPEERAAYGGFSWKPDSSGFYLSTDQGRERPALAFYDVAAAELRFLETPPHDVENVGLSRDGRFLSWSTNEGGWSILHVRDLETGREVPPPAGLPRGVLYTTWAPGAPVIGIQASGPRVPGDVWTWDLASGRLARATASAAAGLDLDAMVLPEAVSFPARDGVTLHGLLYLPRPESVDPAAGTPPVVLEVHGGPTAQARPYFDAVQQYLLARGVAVLDFNYRGSTGFGKTFARLDDRRHRLDGVRDLADAVAWLERDGRVDATRAAIMGGSYGGFLAFAALTEHPDLFDAAVSFVGVSNWVTALEGASPQLKASDRLEYGDIDDPADREFFRTISPITNVERVRDPLLVAHGANDPRDPVSESDNFVRAVRERGGEVEYLRFPDEGHGVRKLENRVILYRRVADFLERHLTVRAATAADGGAGDGASR